MRTYFSPLGIAMLTIDMPSMSASRQNGLNQDTSLLIGTRCAIWKMCRGLTIPGSPLSASALAPVIAVRRAICSGSGLKA